MAGRFLVWTGAGILTAGFSAATITGAGPVELRREEKHVNREIRLRPKGKRR
jgi:hypothetical protein